MPSLSFDKGKDGRATAIVKGGDYDGSILYVHSDDTPGRKPKPTINPTRYKKSLPGLKPAQRTRAFAILEEALAGNKPSSVFDMDKPMKELYERILKDTATSKSIELDDEGQFELLPSAEPDKRDVFYIAGQSGSGKSHIAKGIALYYHKLFPSRGVYLISQLKEDKTLDALKFLKRINIQSLVDDPPEIKEFEECLVIFDDYDTLAKAQKDTVLKLIDTLAIMGRHTCTSMLVLSHYLTNYKQTRLILSESTHVVIYPQSTAFTALKHLCGNYVGCDVDDLKRYCKWGSRWLMFAKGFPIFCIGQRDAELLNSHV